MVSLYERDKALPSVKVFVALAEQFEVDLHWLLTGVGRSKQAAYKKLVQQLVPDIDKYVSSVIDREEKLK